MTTYSSNFALFAAFASFAVAIYFYIKMRDAQKILREGAAHYDTLNKHARKLEQDLHQNKQNFENTFHVLKIADQKSANSLRILEASYESLKKEFEQRKQELEYKCSSIEMQKTHLFKQNETLTQKIESLDLASQELSAIKSTRNQETQQKAAELKEFYEKKIDSLMTELRASQEELLKTLNNREDEKDKLKRRAAQYERLFFSMKSLREMADERASNWEVALKLMANWILETKNLEKPTEIGPLVGHALEALNTTLIEENHEEFALQKRINEKTDSGSDIGASSGIVEFTVAETH